MGARGRGEKSQGRRRERGADGHLELLSLSFSLFPEKHLLGTAEQAEALPLRGRGEEASFSHKVAGSPVRPSGKGKAAEQGRGAGETVTPADGTALPGLAGLDRSVQHVQPRVTSWGCKRPRGGIGAHSTPRSSHRWATDTCSRHLAKQTLEKKSTCSFIHSFIHFRLHLFTPGFLRSH